MTVGDDQLRSPSWLAQRLGKSAKTLETWRRQGTGPAFVRVGRDIRYRESDVERWLTAQTVGKAVDRG